MSYYELDLISHIRFAEDFITQQNNDVIARGASTVTAKDLSLHHIKEARRYANKIVSENNAFKWFIKQVPQSQFDDILEEAPKDHQIAFLVMQLEDEA